MKICHETLGLRSVLTEFINKMPVFQQFYYYFALKLALCMFSALHSLYKLMFNPKTKQDEQSRIS